MAAANLFPELFAGLLRDAVTRFLRLDPNSPRYLAPLSGKIICLRLTPLDWRIYLRPETNAVDILPDFGGEPDVSFAGSPFAFAGMALSDSPRRALFAGAVNVEGDMKTARQFQDLFEQLDINWEALLAQHTGEGLAALLTGALRATHAWGLDTLDAWRMNVAEYLQEESRDLPAAAEAELFFDEVDGLRADFDRLEARILRLEHRG